MIAVANHFEPSIVPGAPPGTYADPKEQERRVDQWCQAYPGALARFRDADGYPLRHTYFFPAEQYDKGLVTRLADHCHAGWGEIEIHLHHGTGGPDTRDNTLATLLAFRDALVDHGCLSLLDGGSPPRYAFVHGNWALANSAGGLDCGVDGEMQILAATGCYADLTLPAAPHPAQVSKINSLYECTLPLSQRAPHRRGRDLRVGLRPSVLPVIIQGPLGLRWRSNGRGIPQPRIENGELSTTNPPTITRFRLWRRAAIRVRGRPDWVFIKLHCHGIDPRDDDAMYGHLMQDFLDRLRSDGLDGDTLHFVTAREMVNIILAACDGYSGDPGRYRDYRLRLLTPSIRA